MNLIEEAAKRLRQLEEAGVARTPHASVVAPAAHARRIPSESAKRPAEARAAEARPASQERTLDLGRLRASGFITPGAQHSRLLHEFRVIKRPLIQHALGRSATQAPNRNLIMVTSALPGEGKTYLAVNLAMSLAMEVDCRVLLVDADVPSPSIPGLLGIEPAKGLMDVLTGEGTPVREALLGTNIERLTLLLAGTPHANAAEFLSSDAMTRLLSELSNRYQDRIVVFDSPPLLATSESRALATHMGQVIVAVEAQRTTHAVLESALATVESCPLVYTLLNKAPESNDASAYGAYGYGS
jgi:receptor protein-tyrosine kinase